MKEMARAINDGAKAFLTAEYKILVFFVTILFVLIGVGIGNWITAVCFLVGALFPHWQDILEWRSLRRPMLEQPMLPGQVE